jgi:ABC-type sugar transport system substrate-binding protein
MWVALRRLLAVLLVAAGLFAGTGITAPTARALGWGAIAISPDTGRVGYSKGMNSAIKAEQAAVGLCNARDCRAVVNFTNACGAVAQAFNASWAVGRDRSSTGAQNRALIACSQHGAGCRVIGWICS